MEWLFWLLVVALAYSYFIYPLILMVLPKRTDTPVGVGQPPLPSVSLIVTAHNEERRITGKLENSLAIDYPPELLEVIVASDCSSDGTDRIVSECAPGRVRLVRADQRLGKEYAQLCAIRAALGEVIVFSDVATQIPAEAIRNLVAWFSDPGVGAVSSEDRFISSSGAIAGEGAYVRYEMWLRRQESRLAGLVGLSGSFFAARKAVCDEWDIYSPSDFNTALNCARLGYRAVTASNVLGYYTDIADPSREYQRKVRTVLRGMTALSRHPEVLNPLRHGLFAFQVFSHKLMRWAVPWLMLAVIPVSLALVDDGLVYQLAVAAQAAFYALGISAHFAVRLRQIGAVRIGYFFLQVNLALAHSLVKFVSGQRMHVWTPSVR